MILKWSECTNRERESQAPSALCLFGLEMTVYSKYLAKIGLYLVI